MMITRHAPLTLLAAALLLASPAIAQQRRATEPVRSVLTRDEWVREWVVRVESTSRLVGELVDAPGTEPDRLRVAYPLPATFAWGGMYNDTLWTSIELPNGRSGNDHFLELADDGTINIIAEVPNNTNPLEFEHRVMFTVQTHAISDIDEQRATSQYQWPGIYPPDIAGYLEPEPFIESNHERIKAFVARATRNRSPRSVPPYQLAKHLAGEVMRHGTATGPGNLILPEILERDTDGTLVLDNRTIRQRARDRNIPMVRQLLDPPLQLELIREIGRLMSGSRPLQTRLQGRIAGVTAPPTPIYFHRQNNRLPNLVNHLQFCAPRDGFLVQSALQASLGEQVTEEGLANLLVAVYRAAGIPARLTIAIDQRAVYRRTGIEPTIIDLRRAPQPNADDQLLEFRAWPVQLSPRVVPVRPRLVRRHALPSGPRPSPPPMVSNDQAIPSQVGGFPTNAIFRPIVEFYLTQEDGNVGEWIPVDIVRMRTEFNPPPALDIKWEHFGRIRNADMLIPVAHHWVAPGHAFTDRAHIWGIWPAFAARGSGGQSPHRSFTCIWATERINTGEPDIERSLILPVRSPN